MNKSQILALAALFAATGLNAKAVVYNIVDTDGQPRIESVVDGKLKRITDLNKRECYNISIDQEGRATASPTNGYKGAFCGGKSGVAWVHYIINNGPSDVSGIYRDSGREDGFVVPAKGDYKIDGAVPWQRYGNISISVDVTNEALIRQLLG